MTWPKGILLHGPSGVGKSSAVAQIASECRCKVYTVTPATLIGQYMGESERRLRDIFEEAKQGAATSSSTHIILIEEADALFPKRKPGVQNDARLVAQLLTLMDGVAAKEQNFQGHVVVIAITGHPNSIDSALRRPGRFEKEIAIPVPDVKARRAILEYLVKDMNTVQNLNVDLIAQKCHGYTGADLRSLCSAALMRSLSSTSDHACSYRLLLEKDFFDAMPEVGASVARSVVEKFPPASWDDIGGLDDVKLALQQAAVWPITRSKDFKRLGIKFPKGVLLHGPPGCAKTTLARAAVTASGATFIPLLGTNLYSMYVGDGEAELRRAFSRARLSSPSVLFIDEIDAVVGSRADKSSDDSGVESSTRLLTTLLTEMDGIDNSTGVLVLGTTNRPFAIDSALLRPGRFDVHIFVPPPDTLGRIQALRVHTRTIPLDNSVSLEEIAGKTEGFTGAEIQSLCREAAMAALRENVKEASIVFARHFDRALDGIRPAHTEEELQRYAAWPSSTE